MKTKTSIKASSSAFNVLGTYEGEVLDTNITNLNGLDITREVMEYLFESEDYKKGIENGWYIGYLGHPEDPNCMEFEKGCIVMTEAHIDDNGKVYGKFNLIDTPVGQIVKKFQDAGVVFGISIRGAGDIIDNSVDPETFVFRGFDLVSFPAYPESIPTFSAIAASTKLEERKKYQAICSTVKNNLNSITSASTIDVLKSQFAPQSEEYKLLEQRKSEICASNTTKNTTFNMDKQRVEALTDLYISASEKITDLMLEIDRLKRKNAENISATSRKISSMKRILGGQIDNLTKSLDSVTASRDALRKRSRTIMGSQSTLKSECDDLMAQCEQTENEKSRLESTIDALREKNKELRASCVEKESALKASQSLNLKYKQKINACEQESENKSEIIVNLQSELRETVTAAKKVSSSNRDVDNKTKSDLKACKALLREYQDGFASLYCSAIGVDPTAISFTDATTINQMKKMISSATNTANIPAMVSTDTMYVSFDDGVDYEDEMITL